MKRCLMCLALLIPSFPMLAQDYLPRDVQRFVDRRDGCDDIRRMKEASRDMLKVCAGTDKELSKLKRKYAANSTIMQILNQFEAGIEAAETPVVKSRTVKRTG